MKLNLGSGVNGLDGYENIDIKDGRTAYPLEVDDGSCDEIRASHLLEHFGMAEVADVIKHWVSKLKTGGVLKVAVPNFAKIAKDYTEGHYDNIGSYVMGGQTDEYDFHKTLFDIQSLKQLLETAGLTDITEWTSECQDCAALPVSLNLQGTRQSDTVKRKVIGVMSMPRLCFTDNMNCVMTELLTRGIPIKKGTGVFWGQVLSRMMEEARDEGNDYIVAVDYDTWFRHEHLQHLLTLMETHPEADAICPVQMKRDGDIPLMGLLDDDGKPLKEIDLRMFDQELLPIGTGHFGLTVFRASSLAKLKKPWFMGLPNDDGEWGDNRTDDDIYFWRNFLTCGLKPFIAPRVNIGHIQLMCSFPGHHMDKFKCINKHLGDLGEVEGVPEHCR
jgi:predicted SAM-dependent methyltransferase